MLKGEKWLFSYIDNSIVCSPTWEGHISGVEHMFPTQCGEKDTT